MVRLLIRMISCSGDRRLGVEQVLYRYPNRAEPCFSSRLCPEELNSLIQIPTASHKIERRGMAQKRLTDWPGLGSAAKETVDPVHSILSIDAGLGMIQMNEGGYADMRGPFARPS